MEVSSVGSTGATNARGKATGAEAYAGAGFLLHPHISNNRFKNITRRYAGIVCFPSGTLPNNNRCPGRSVPGDPGNPLG